MHMGRYIMSKRNIQNICNIQKEIGSWALRGRYIYLFSEYFNIVG